MRHWFVIVATLTLGLGVVSIAQQPTKKAPDIPGITAKDPYANGCVSCHVVLPNKVDVRINQGLKKVKGHPNVAGMMKNIPNDCMSCHARGKANSLDRALHKAHFGKKEKSLFVTEFGGSCTNCHTLDLKTGKSVVKSGPKNW